MNDFIDYDNIVNDEEELYDVAIDDVIDDFIDKKDIEIVIEDDDEIDDDIDIDEDKIKKNKLFKIGRKMDKKTVIVKPQNRITSEIMTSYEYSQIVGTRATHIANGSVIFTNVENLTDPRDIAQKEIKEQKCPLSIIRKLRNGDIEIWTVNEMTKPFDICLNKQI